MELSIGHFRTLWKSANEELDAKCQSWESLVDDSTIPDDVLGEIRTVTGLAKLLQGQKLKQFCGLIDDSEFKKGEKEITLVDLEGFWDMVYNEVEKIQKSFKKLEICQNNGWNFVEEQKENVQPKKVAKNILPKKDGKVKEHAEAARQRIAEIKKKMKAQQQKANNSENPSKPTDMLVVEPNLDKKCDDAPSPCKRLKKGTVKPAKKSLENKASPKKHSKDKAERNSAARSKAARSTRDKENANILANSKKSKENVDSLAEKTFMQMEKRLTRSARKAMLVQLEATQNL